jgi:hypothetical protein
MWQAVLEPLGKGVVSGTVNIYIPLLLEAHVNHRKGPTQRCHMASPAAQGGVPQERWAFVLLRVASINF